MSIRSRKRTSALSALVLAAHADDETLGAGGTIQKLIRSGWGVDVVILSSGIVHVRGREQDNRSGALAACKRLGARAPRFLGFADQKFDRVAMAALANAVSDLKLEPDLVIAHSETDLNLDHQIASQVARIIARPKKKPISLLACEIPSTTFWSGKPFPANFYTDISAEIQAKIDAFTCYKNEIQPYPHPWSREGLKLLAQYHGMQCGFRFAEAFTLIRGYEGRLP